MAKRDEILSKAIDELLDEFEDYVHKSEMAPTEAKLAEDEQGDPLAPQDNKGGLQPVGAPTGAPKSNPGAGLGNEPTSSGIEVKVPGGAAPKQSGNGMGQDSTSSGIEVKMPLKSASAKGDAMGNDPIAIGGQVLKAEGSTPPGFKGKDDDKSEGAEDESAEDESEEGSEEGHDEGAEGEEHEEGEGEEAGEGEEGSEGFGGEEGQEGGEQEDPEMDARVEKALYKFMAKIGMTGEMGKADEIAKSDDLANLDPITLEPRIQAAENLAKSETESLRKSLGEELVKRDSEIAELKALVKGLSDTVARFSKAPVSRPRAVTGYTPLQKSEGDGPQFSKNDLINKALDLMKAGKLHDKTLVAKMEMAPVEVAVALARQAGLI